MPLMKRVEYWRWRIVSDTSGKLYNSKHRMDEETALRRHPEAVRVPGSMEVRMLPETDEEKAANWPSAWQRNPGTPSK